MKAEEVQVKISLDPEQVELVRRASMAALQVSVLLDRMASGARRIAVQLKRIEESQK